MKILYVVKEHSRWCDQHVDRSKHTGS